MVFQDGGGVIGDEGSYRAPLVFDNLIHKGEMPVTIGIFINPGHLGDELPEAKSPKNNRSVEYDTVSDLYARFLLEEILPEVAKTHNLTDDPERRATWTLPTTNARVNMSFPKRRNEEAREAAATGPARIRD